MRKDYESFKNLNAEILVVGPDSLADFKEYFTAHEMPFPGLADHDHKIADMYGQEVNLIKLGRMPAIIIIDDKGIVRYAYYGKSMSDIPENKEILNILKDLI